MSARSTAIRRVLPILLALVALGLAALTVADHRHALSVDVRRIGPGALVIAALGGLIGGALVAGMWRTVLLGLGARAPVGVSTRVFLTSQLGKYLPGSVWPLLAQIEFGRRVGISRRRMLSANVLTLVLSLVVGMVVAGAVLPFSSRSALHRYWWTLLFLPLLVACLQPRLIPAALDRLFRLARREPLDARLEVRTSVRAGAWALLSWLALGLHIYVLARPFGASGFSAFLAATGGISLAVVAGILVIPAPAGAGIRDAVLVATLAPEIGTTSAIAVALASRVILIGADVVLALLSLALGRRVGPAPETAGP